MEKMKYIDFKLGEKLIHRWTNCFSQYQAIVEVVKINPKSVVIKLLTAPEEYVIGQTWRVKTELWQQTPNNGLFEGDFEEPGGEEG